MNRSALLTLALVTSLLNGCAASLVYDSDRSRQRQDCYRIQDPKERQRCLDTAAVSPDDYRRVLAQAG